MAANIWAAGMLLISFAAEAANTTLPKDWVSINGLIDELYFRESTRGKKLLGDEGRAVGPLHTWKIMVREANRILGEDRYTYADRHDYKKSREICTIFLTHHLSRYRKKNNGRWPSRETMLRSWKLGEIELWRK